MLQSLKIKEKMKTVPLERRKFDRIQQNSAAMPSATISMVKPFFQEPFEVEIHNVSAGGLKIYSHEHIPLNSEFELELNLPEQPAIRRKGKAVYKISSDFGFNVGINFIDPDRTAKPKILSSAQNDVREPWDWLGDGRTR